MLLGKIAITYYPKKVGTETIKKNIVRWLWPAVTFGFWDYLGSVEPPMLNREEVGNVMLKDMCLRMIVPPKGTANELLKPNVRISDDIFDTCISMLRVLSAEMGIYIPTVLKVEIDSEKNLHFDDFSPSMIEEMKSQNIILFPSQVENYYNDMTVFMLFKFERNPDRPSQPLISMINCCHDRLLDKSMKVVQNVSMHLLKVTRWLSEDDKSNMSCNIRFGMYDYHDWESPIITLEPSLTIMGTLNFEASAAIIILEMINVLLDDTILQHRHKILQHDIRPLFLNAWKILVRAVLFKTQITKKEILPSIYDFLGQKIKIKPFQDYKLDDVALKTFTFQYMPTIHWGHEMIMLFLSFYDNPASIHDCVGKNTSIVVESIDDTVYQYKNYNQESQSNAVTVEMRNGKICNINVPELKVYSVPSQSAFDEPGPKRRIGARRALLLKRKNPYDLKVTGKEMVKNYRQRMLLSSEATEEERSDDALNSMFPDYWARMSKRSRDRFHVWNMKGASPGERTHHHQSQDYMDQLHALTYVEKTDSYNGLVRGQAQMATDLDPEWVTDCFHFAFLEMVVSTPGTIWKIPVGDAKNEVAPVDCVVPEFAIAYYQGSKQYCLAYSIASALSYIGYENEAQQVSEIAEELSKLPYDKALKGMRERLTKIVPDLGNAWWYNKRLNRSGSKKKERCMSISTLLEPSPVLSIVQPIGKDGSCSHIIAIVDDLIFDSSSVEALKLDRNSLNWSCDGICNRIGWVLRYFQPKRGSKCDRTAKVNWDKDAMVMS